MSTMADLFLEKARKVLQTTRDLLKAGYANEAARNAYIAAFHAAQAYIVAHTGKVAKTHNGVHSQFGQLAIHDAGLAGEISSFLPRAFKLKSIVDYELGEGSDVPLERAADAVEKAGRFVDCIAALLAQSEKTTKRKE